MNSKILLSKQTNAAGWDLICMGRAAVDLYSEQIGASLEEASTFAKYVGGCAANIAIGTSRLGLNTAILSRVGNEAMGRFVSNTFAKEGVDVSLLRQDNERLTALVLLGINPPDRFPLIFYRENCADMAIQKSDFSLSDFQKTKALLITGTHCSTDHAFSVTKHAVGLAKQAGCKLIIDIDYRPVLWGAAGHGDGESRYAVHKRFSERMLSLMPHMDLVVGTEEEILAATDKENMEEALNTLRKNCSALIVQKRGERGCIAYPSDIDRPVLGSPLAVKVLNVLGAGDAFMSGFLRGYLRGLSVKECCDLGNANGALVVTRHGCSPAMPYWKELQFFMERPEAIEQTEKLHRSIKNFDAVDNLCLLAFDHRAHFENLANESGLKLSEISYFKEIVFSALKKARKFFPEANLGLIVDDQYGGQILNDAASENIYTARCIEENHPGPLNFLNNKEAGVLLRSWPKEHVIKVLSRVSSCRKTNHEQLSKLEDLFEASKVIGHPLLIEFVNAENPDNLNAIKETIQSCYRAEIFPAWWKLPPVDDPIAWQEIEKVIEENDPHCHGVLLLGENRPLEEVAKALQIIRSRQSKVKGFAVGRSIWGETAEEWFHGRINDHEAIDRIAKNFMRLVAAWLSTNIRGKEINHDRNFEVKQR